MAEKNETGNPVFDYRAGFRATAARVQNGLLLFGAAVLLIAGVLLIVAGINPSQRQLLLIAAIAGAAMFLAGVGWGFYWRRSIRAEFRNKYGPPG